MRSNLCAGPRRPATDPPSPVGCNVLGRPGLLGASRSAGNRCGRATHSPRWHGAFQTGATSNVDLRGEKIDVAFRNLLFFQDPIASAQPALSAEGHSTQTLVGTIYIPEADFVYTGNGTGEVLDAQIISDEFSVTGGGELSINYDATQVYQFKGIGLVQ
ncbi:MAG: hypothetical protein HYX54_10000 [Chloroflexi bacterium]|nr:hypothetical protein [Chloroflexota bacterium]